MLYLRAVGLVAGDVESRGVVDVHGYIVQARTESKLLNNIAENHCLLHCQCGGHELCLRDRLCRQPSQPHLEADRAVQKKRRFPVVGAIAPVRVGERH